MKRVLASITNDLVTDQRVLKICGYLQSKGCHITLIGRKLPGSLAVTSIPFDCIRFRMIFRKGIGFYAEFNLRLFFYMLFKKCDILLANDLDTLLAHYLVSVIRKKDLVYDTHEYYTEVPELQDSPIKKRIWEAVEKFIFPRLKTVYTVNDSIAKIYSDKYSKKVFVVRNISKRYHTNIKLSRAALGLPSDKNIIVLQGSGINKDRGAEEVLEAMTHIDNCILLLLGSGDVIKQLKTRAMASDLQAKVVFKGKLPYNEMMQYTAAADAGLSVDKDTNLNYHFSLPNKIFDYIQAGIPIICSNLPEVSAIIKNYNIGLICPSHEPKVIANTIMKVLDEGNKKQWTNNLKKAAEELCWEKESERLNEIYDWVLQK